MLAPPAADTAERELEVWAQLERLHATVARALDRTLERRHGLSLHGLEVLQALESTPAQRLRMSALAALLPLTPSGVTRLVERLERKGLVERVHCPEDARVTYAQLTDAGRTTLRAAAKTHRACVSELLLARFTTPSLTDLQQLLRAQADTPASCLQTRLPEAR